MCQIMLKFTIKWNILTGHNLENQNLKTDGTDFSDDYNIDFILNRQVRNDLNLTGEKTFKKLHEMRQRTAAYQEFFFFF